MRTIMLLVGLPASGKSTFARELLKKEPGRWKRIGRDFLREMLDDHRFDATNEEFVVKIQDSVIRSALRSGFDVILDNTHLVGSTVRRVHKLAESIGDVKVIEKAFNVSVEECLKRNALRQGHARVPDDAITGMAQRSGISKGRTLVGKEVYHPLHATREAAEQDVTLPRTVVCDLDGTLAIMGDRSPYDASQCDLKDTPNAAVVECVKAMHSRGYKIIFVSGREDKDREPTERFIQRHVTQFNMYNKSLGADLTFEVLPIPYELFMRPTGDNRKDSVVKREIFEKNIKGSHYVEFVLDDRNQVVEMWRNELGLNVFQVNDGDF